ncbi:hypothetical protein VNO77_16648 [Canavalia gladiata]|uniref:Uncharacterized protein n=1 Tax=Canavalia gladiata TaxID=3824 RepID=A0AAN9LI64_CANGL
MLPFTRYTSDILSSKHDHILENGAKPYSAEGKHTSCKYPIDKAFSFKLEPKGKYQMMFEAINDAILTINKCSKQPFEQDKVWDLLS